jgi:hypothetical protein
MRQCSYFVRVLEISGGREREWKCRKSINDRKPFLCSFKTRPSYNVVGKVAQVVYFIQCDSTDWNDNPNLFPLDCMQG